MMASPTPKLTLLTLSLSTLTSYLTTLTSAQSPDLLGCSSISCPTHSVNGISEPNCIVGDDHLVSLGILTDAIPLARDNTALSLTIGRRHRGSTSEQATNVFFLGAPEGVSLIQHEEYSGCALFFGFHGATIGNNAAAAAVAAASAPVTANVEEDEATTDQQQQDQTKKRQEHPADLSTSSSCAPYLGPHCLDPIHRVLSSWTGEAFSKSCQDLAASIPEILNATNGVSDVACSFPLSTLSVQGVPILGDGGPPFFSAHEQHSSNCHPMASAGRRLAKLGWEQHFSTVHGMIETDGFTPVMTVVYDQVSGTTEVGNMCMRPVDKYITVPKNSVLGAEAEEEELGGESKEGHKSQEAEEKKKNDHKGDEEGLGGRMVVDSKSLVMSLGVVALGMMAL